ncbi:MAG: hypothetical protein ACLFR8_07375 [Alkalispirochaeta sp.]
MNIRKTLPPAIAAYQIFRFFALALAILTHESLVDEVVLRGGILSLSAGSLVTVILLLQYFLTGAAPLLTPLRVVKFLEAASAGVFVALQIVGPRLWGGAYLLRGIAPIFFFVDTMVFLFLLLLPGKER